MSGKTLDIAANKALENSALSDQEIEELSSASVADFLDLGYFCIDNSS